MVEDQPKKKQKQTRRSISISKTTYERLKEYCQNHNLSMSGVVEHEIKKLLDYQDEVLKAG